MKAEKRINLSRKKDGEAKNDEKIFISKHSWLAKKKNWINKKVFKK